MAAMCHHYKGFRNPHAHLANEFSAARQEALALAGTDLWDEAIERCGGTFSDPVGLTYVRLVLDSCAEHRKK